MGSNGYIPVGYYWLLDYLAQKGFSHCDFREIPAISGKKPLVISTRIKVPARADLKLPVRPGTTWAKTPYLNLAGIECRARSETFDTRTGQ